MDRDAAMAGAYNVAYGYLVSHSNKRKEVLDMVIESIDLANKDMRVSTSVTFDTGPLGEKFCRAIIIYLRHEHQLDVKLDHPYGYVPQINTYTIDISWGEKL